MTRATETAGAVSASEYVVIDTESDARSVIGTYAGTEEDVVHYHRPDGSLGHAPADCVAVKRATRAAEPAGAVSASLPNGRYDSAERRQSVRKGRERGCWVYIPAEELLRCGVDLDGPPPLYRTWGARRGSALVRLYRGKR